jgi:succinylglutamate desuccinylase
MTIDYTLQKHLLGIYNTQQEGPLIIAIGGIHGNEHAGIWAIRNVLSQLNYLQPKFRGIFIGIAGNLAALQQQKRYIDHDLNRQWYPEKVHYIHGSSIGSLSNSEDLQQKELLRLFNTCKVLFKPQYQNKQIILIDLHTFSAPGKAYSIATKMGSSNRWASDLQAPVILGMEDVIQGTTMHHFNNLDMTSFCFEAGQHTDPASIATMESALWVTLHNIGCLAQPSIQQFKDHYDRLVYQRKERPKMVQFMHRHAVNLGDNFVMQPGYRNFQLVKKGELLAHDKNGPIESLYNGMILMPLYQQQGEDGFFLVEAIA